MAEAPDDDDRDRRLDRLVAAHLEAADAGRRPDRARVLADHPDLAADLAEFFADRDRLERVAAPLRDVARAAWFAGTLPAAAWREGRRTS